MGLGIEVGVLANLVTLDPEGADWLRAELRAVNRALAKEGLAPHVEPEQLPLLKSRSHLMSYPYSFLHYLRRVMAHVLRDPAWKATPVPEGADPGDDPLVLAELEHLRNHLICHADDGGFYLPVDFRDVIVADEPDAHGGGIIGSSYRLRDELIVAAPSLGIEIKDGDISDAEAERINRESSMEGHLWIEKIVWLSLFEAARLSIEHHTAVCFN
jgi:hypothetical protein